MRLSRCRRYCKSTRLFIRLAWLSLCFKLWIASDHTFKSLGSPLRQGMNIAKYVIGFSICFLFFILVGKRVDVESSQANQTLAGKCLAFGCIFTQGFYSFCHELFALLPAQSCFMGRLSYVRGSSMSSLVTK
jgi:hypothetical protein